ATLSPEEFRALAEEFDSRVVAIRRAQDTKARALAKRRETAQQQFYRDALPVIAELVGERGAVAVLDRSVVLLSAEQIDITDAVIARIDAKTDTGDRDQQVQPADDAPAPLPGNPDPAAPPVTGTQP
ncbi:MAG: OmpH family outer membrane protein, partial [Rhodovulum sp.]